MQLVFQLPLEVVHIREEQTSSRLELTILSFPEIAEGDLELPARGAEAGGDRLFGHPQRGCYLPVAVAVVVAQDQSSRLLGGQLSNGVDHLRAFGERGRIGRGSRPPEPLDHLAHPAQPLPPAVRDGDVDGDPVQPGLRGSVRAPGAPALVGALERVLDAVLRRRPVAQERDQRAEDAAVRVAVEALEIGLRAGLVGLDLRIARA